MKRGWGTWDSARVTCYRKQGGRIGMRTGNGRLVQFDPSRWKGISFYTAEDRTIAVGDRLQWREPDNKRRIANGKFVTITALDQQNIEVRFEGGRKLAMALSEARKVDLGYCSTSHASQGSTVDRVIVNIDAGRSAEIVNDRMLYVAISRARFDSRVYTNSIEGMRRAVARTQEKELALNIAPERSYQQSAGMRI